MDHFYALQLRRPNCLALSTGVSTPLWTTLWRRPLKYLEGVSCYSHPVPAIPHVCEHGWAWKEHASGLSLPRSDPPAFGDRILSISRRSTWHFTAGNSYQTPSRGLLSHPRETMTSALRPSRERRCVGQLCCSRNRSVPRACGKPAMFGSTCSSLPCCSSGTWSRWSADCGVPCPKWGKWSTEKVCLHIRAEMSSPVFFILTECFFLFVFFFPLRLVWRESSADCLGFLR